MKRWKKLIVRRDSPPALPVREGALRLLKKLAVMILKYLQVRKQCPLVPALFDPGVAPSQKERAGGESLAGGESPGESPSSASSPNSQALSSLRSDCQASSRKIDLLVVHCTATWPSIDYTLERLVRDHRARGFGTYAGYHVYVRRDGTIHYCRPVSLAGCHVSNYNRHSIGICYEGGLTNDRHPADTRTAEQLVALHEVLTLLLDLYPDARLVGHKDLNPHKACPCFDVRHEYAYLLYAPHTP